MNENEIVMNGETYVCQSEGETLKIGRRTGDRVEWLESVPKDRVPDELALRGVVSALVERGG